MRKPDGGGRGVSDWWSIEVFDASELPARRWKDSYQDDLTEAALTNGAIEWAWHEHRYGVVFEVLFDSDEQWEAFRALPAVRSALDGAPDPVNGLIVYRGRGGGSGPRKPRKPKPAPGASAMALPEPAEERVLHLAGVAPPGRPRRLWQVRFPPAGKAPGRTVQDGGMRETRVLTDGLRAAIERSGYYPGLVSDAVASALGSEPVTAYVVHHDAIFDPGMEVRRHMTVLALTPTRLVYSHTDEHPAEDPDSRPRAETSTEAIRFAKISSVALSRVVPDPAAYVPGVTMPSEVMLTIGWNVLSHLELEPAHCGDESCEADHGYLRHDHGRRLLAAGQRGRRRRGRRAAAAELRAGAVRRHRGPRKLKTRWAVADSPFRFAAAARPVAPCSGKMLSGTHE